MTFIACQKVYKYSIMLRVRGLLISLLQTVIYITAIEYLTLPSDCQFLSEP